MIKSKHPTLLRVGSAKRLTRGIVAGLQIEDGDRPYNLG